MLKWQIASYVIIKSSIFAIKIMGKKIILAVLFIMMVGAVNADNHRLYLFRSNNNTLLIIT